MNRPQLTESEKITVVDLAAGEFGDAVAFVLQRYPGSDQNGAIWAVDEALMAVRYEIGQKRRAERWDGLG